jgi:hypothetical protein
VRAVERADGGRVDRVRHDDHGAEPHEGRQRRAREHALGDQAGRAEHREREDRREPRVAHRQRARDGATTGLRDELARGLHHRARHRVREDDGEGDGRREQAELRRALEHARQPELHREAEEHEEDLGRADPQDAAARTRARARRGGVLSGLGARLGLSLHVGRGAAPDNTANERGASGERL